MKSIFVMGLINIETTLAVDHIPIEYTPVRYRFFGVNSTVSGVGLNIAKALHTLGDNVTFASLIGDDSGGNLTRAELRTLGIADQRVLSHLTATPQSVVIYEPSGRRMIFTDLKDVQETPYPFEHATSPLQACDIAVLCNINFSRAMLAEAQRLGKPIATDVHAISNLDDEYNADYMRAAHLLFMSHERLPDSPESWVRQVWQRYATPIVVIGMGAEGALLAVYRDHFIERIPAVQTRPIVNTIGAGDALFSAFVHSYAHHADPYAALKRAVVFASYKIGTAGAADGFINATMLDALCAQVYSTP